MAGRREGGMKTGGMEGERERENDQSLGFTSQQGGVSWVCVCVCVLEGSAPLGVVVATEGGGCVRYRPLLAI